MSILSQPWLAEGITEGRRESWLIGNATRRGHRENSMVLSLNDNHETDLTSNPLMINTTNNSGNSIDDIMESPGNRRHGLIFPKLPSSPNNRAKMRTWTPEDNIFSHQNNFSEVSSKYRNRVESYPLPPRIPSDSDNISYIPSALNTPPLPRMSKSLRGSSSMRKSSQLLSPSTSPKTRNTLEASSSDFQKLPTIRSDPDNTAMSIKKVGEKMRGKVELQVNDGAPFRGFCYIDEVMGSLQCEGVDENPFSTTVIENLRESQIKPIWQSEGDLRSLELLNRTLGIKIHLLPVVQAEFDHWFAALSSWQDLRPESISKRLTKSSSCGPENNKELRRFRSSSSKVNETKIGNIIKVGKLLLWDKGNPAPLVRKTPNRDIHLPSPSLWRRVSCILQDDGQFKLLTENENIPLCTIQLSQLSRCSVQLIDWSVLGEDYCIAIFPLYAASASELSFFHPVYIASESRLIHEVWFCLLRAFTVPEIYGQRPSNLDDNIENLSISSERVTRDDIFRIEKSIKIRIVEAKLSSKQSVKPKNFQSGKPVKEDAEASTGEYFVEVVLDDEIRARTNTRSDTKNPLWREECEFENLPPQTSSLIIVLKKFIPPISHGFLSAAPKVSTSSEPTRWTTQIPISSLERGTENEAWWPFLDQQQEKAGEILLSIKYDEIAVLLSNDYKPISELLHNFSNGLTIQISQYIPAKLKIVSEIMMNIFQVTGCAGDWLTSLVEDEIDGLEKEIPTDCGIRWIKRIDSEELRFSAVSDREQSVRDMGKSLQEEANLLFRGNSLLTQALDFHMRRVGKEYLEEVLSDKISKINVMNPDCEVDPSRILNNQDTNKNWSLLYSLTTDIWNNIHSSAERCPPELRQILKYIRAVAEDRYGNFLRTVSYTSVSGFLFLRFFCPALLNPKLFGLLRDNPQPKAQRTFTLIAKGLQALANLSNFGKKEAWMEPMNRFLATHRQSMKTFIDTICAISTEDNTSNLPASYSTPITIFGRLPSTSKEGFPSLPYLIDYAKNFSRLVTIWLDATKKRETESFQGELLEFHQLCLQLQERAEVCLFKAEQTNKNKYENHDILDDNKYTSSCNSVNYELSLYKLPRINISAGSRNTQYASSRSTEVDEFNKKESLRYNVREQPSLNDLKYMTTQDKVENSLSSPVRAHYREEWPLKGLLGGLIKKGKDNGEVGNRDSEQNTLSPSSSPGGLL